MSERDFVRRTRVTVDPAADPNFNTPSTPLGGPLPAQGPDPITRWRMRLFSEGPGGVGTRGGIMLRYVVYFFTLVGCSLLTSALLSSAGTTAYGGSLMWFCAALMTLVAGVGTLLQPTNRAEIINSYRHYTFGLSIIPATAIAGVIWALRGVLTSPTAANDTMASLLSFAVPAVFVTTLVIPPIIFVKLIAGYHTMNRSKMTDTEMMAMATRNDHLQY